MRRPTGHNLAELNFGTLRYDWEDPRVAPFVDALARVYEIAARDPGYVWHLDEVEMEREQLDAGGAFGSQPRLASTLSLWRDPARFRAFVQTGVHGAFMARASDWFEPDKAGRVFWWLPEGQVPTVAEGLARHRRMEREGESVEAFAWAGLDAHVSAPQQTS